MPNRVTSAPLRQQPAAPQPRRQPSQAPQRAGGWQPASNRPRPAAVPPRPLVSTGNVQLDLIANARLGTGKDHTCVATVRSNLRHLGMQGLPSSTGQDKNNPRGMMVQMLQSDRWQSTQIPGSTPSRITSPYGSVEAHVLSREDYLKAAEAGQIPQGAVVFQTKHGWDYNGGSIGNDVGIVQGDRIHNYKPMAGMTVYGAQTRDVVVLTPS